MSALVEMARREIEQRRLYLVGGLLLGLLPLAAPLLPFAAGQPGSEVREVAAATLFWIATAIFSLLLGAGLFGRDVAERRLGFYFSRPLAGWTILVGRLLGVLTVALGATALVLLPTALTDRRLFPLHLASSRVEGGMPGQTLAIWLLVTVTLVLGAHYLRTVAMARSVWWVLDLIGVVGTLLALRWIAGLLLGELALGALERALLVVAAGLMLGLAAAVTAQILRGRTAVRLGHRLGSLALWSGIAVALTAAGAYAGWVVAAGPEDLEEARVEAVPADDWVQLGGRARGRAGYRRAFLYRVSDGAHLRLPPGFPRLSFMLSRPGLLFSADGSRVCWPRTVAPRSTGFSIEEWRPFALPAELACADLREPEPELDATPVVLPASGMNHRLLALSADGRRLAHLSGRLLSVEEIDSGRLLAAEILAVDWLPAGELLFDRSGEHLFVVTRPCVAGCRLEVRRLDIVSRRLELVLEMDRGVSWQRDPVGDRLLITQELGGQGSRRWLADLETGDAWAIAPPSDSPGWVASFLADGRLLLRSGLGSELHEMSGQERLIGGSNGELWLADRDGAPLRQLPHPGRYLRLGGQPAPDLLLVAGYDSPPIGQRGRGASTYLIDLRRGEERPVGEGLAPVPGRGAGVGTLGSRLLLHDSGDLLLLDPESLDLSRVLPIGPRDR